VTAHRIVPDRFLGDVCAVCRGQAGMLAIYATLEDGTPAPCPGPPPPAGRNAVLPGTPPLGPGGDLTAEPFWTPERCHPDGDGPGPGIS
jgi:hypothetical protein